MMSGGLKGATGGGGRGVRGRGQNRMPHRDQRESIKFATGYTWKYKQYIQNIYNILYWPGQRKNGENERDVIVLYKDSEKKSNAGDDMRGCE